VRIHRSRPGSGFTLIPNETLRDERLSFAARGHLAYLLSLPDLWKTSADEEADRARRLRPKRKGEGREAMRAIYTELKKAGYMRLVRSADAATGRWKTETHLFDRPQSGADSPEPADAGQTDDHTGGTSVTEVRVTDSPESRMSVPPAQTQEPVDNPNGYHPEYADDVLPGRTDIRETGQSGTRHVGNPTPGEPYVKTEDLLRSTDNEDPHSAGVRVGDPIADKEQPIANSQTPRVPDGPETLADDAQHIPPSVQVQSPATGRNARAGNGAAPDSDEDSDFAHPNGQADTVGPNPPPAASDATTSPDSSDAEDHRRRVLDDFAAWIREHPEAVTP